MLSVRAGSRHKNDGGAIRYPDALVTCTKFPETKRIAPDVQVVFEVLSADSERRDRIEKVREYAAVRSIRHHIIVEGASADLLVLHRRNGEDAWRVLTLTGDDTLSLPESASRSLSRNSTRMWTSLKTRWACCWHTEFPHARHVGSGQNTHARNWRTSSIDPRDAAASPPTWAP
jgi:hypothetical protein